MMKKSLGLFLLLSVTMGMVRAIMPPVGKIVEWAKTDNLDELIRCIPDKPLYAFPLENPYPHETMIIDISGIFSPGDMDFDPVKEKGKNYTIYDLVARESKPKTVVALLENRFEKLPTTISRAKALLPLCSFYGFSLNINGVEFEHGSEKTSITGDCGRLIFESAYLGNLLAIAAEYGRLDVVKAIVEWLEAHLKALNAPELLPQYLNFPVANFTKGMKGFVFGGTPLISALQEKEYGVARYLLEKGALPIGSAHGTNKAFFIPIKDGSFGEVGEINVQQLISEATLKTDNVKTVALDKKEGTPHLQQKKGSGAPLKNKNIGWGNRERNVQAPLKY